MALQSKLRQHEQSSRIGATYPSIHSAGSARAGCGRRSPTISPALPTPRRPHPITRTHRHCAKRDLPPSGRCSRPRRSPRSGNGFRRDRSAIPIVPERPSFPATTNPAIPKAMSPITTMPMCWPRPICWNWPIAPIPWTRSARSWDASPRSDIWRRGGATRRRSARSRPRTSTAKSTTGASSSCSSTSPMWATVTGRTSTFTAHRPRPNCGRSGAIPTRRSGKRLAPMRSATNRERRERASWKTRTASTRGSRSRKGGA